MESDPKKVKASPLYEELLLNLFADNVRILEILRRTDVEEALNLYIAVAGDPAFFKVIKIMDTNLIWNEWFQRDMAAIYKFDEWDSETVLWETEDKPTWKVYYLWFRFLVASRQYYLLAFKNGNEPTRLRFRFKNLNVAEIDGRNVDLRKFIPNYEQEIRNMIPVKDNVFEVLLEHFFTKFVVYDTNVYSAELSVVYNVFASLHWLLTYTKVEKRGYLLILNELAATFPRTHPKKGNKIVLASCIECKLVCSNPQVERNNTNRVFCDKDCQRSFYNAL